MQQNPNQDQNSGNLHPQNPQPNPINQTYVGTTPQNNSPKDTGGKSESIKKIVQMIWFVAGFINVILALRIIFLLFNARSSGFTAFLYNLTSPFVIPFNGIFPTPNEAGFYFDTAALVAIIIYSLATWGIVTLVRILSSTEKSA